VRVEQHQADQRTERRTDPEAAVDRQIDATAHARRN
jgi:hypothetical protein